MRKTFLKKFLFFLLSFLCSLLNLGIAVAASAQTPLPYEIAAVFENEVWLFGVDGRAEPVTQASPATAHYSGLAWSPDGTRLTFTGRDETGNLKLYLLESPGTPPLVVAEGLYPFLPVSWSPDGQQIVYALPTTDLTTPAMPVQVFAYQPQAGGAPELLGTFTYRADCGDPGAPIPSDVRARMALSNTDRETTALLALTPFGLMHSVRCSQLDVWLMNTTTGNDSLLYEGVHAVSLLPDNSRAVVGLSGQLAFISSPAGPYTQVIIPGDPNQVALGPEGSSDTYYSIRTLSSETPMSEAARELIGQQFFNLPMSYLTEIRRFNSRTGVDDVIVSQEIFTAGSLSPSVDGRTLMYSRVPNPEAWVEAIESGALTAETLAGPTALDTIQTEVVRLDLSTGLTQTLGRGWSQVAVNPGL